MKDMERAQLELSIAICCFSRLFNLLALRLSSLLKKKRKRNRNRKRQTWVAAWVALHWPLPLHPVCAWAYAVPHSETSRFPVRAAALHSSSLSHSRSRHSVWFENGRLFLEQIEWIWLIQESQLITVDFIANSEEESVAVAVTQKECAVAAQQQQSLCILPLDISPIPVTTTIR